MSLTPDIRGYLFDLAKRLDATEHNQRGAIIDAAEAFLGLSRQTIYRQLKKECGWDSGRKARADKGKTGVDIHALNMLGTAQREGLRKNDKQTVFTPLARSVLEQNNVELKASNAHLNKLLRDRNLDVNSQRNAKPVQGLRAEHPNYLHQVDPSLCLVYYLKNKQYMIRDDQLYKNKLDTIAKIKFKVWRYTGYDRASGAIKVRYFEAAGENQHILFDFLMYMWGKQDNVLMHGVPKFMYWDQGSAMTSAAIKNLLLHLEVERLEHLPGNARAKGGVENANNIVETQFESRLRFQPVNDIAELNAAAEAWQEAYNANLIPHQDTRLKRHGLPKPVARYDLWQLIRAEQIRLLPAIEVCRALMTSKEVERTVQPDMCVTYKHQSAESTLRYDLKGLDGITVKSKVIVRGLAYGDCAIQVQVPRYDGEMMTYRVEPIRDYDHFGQRLSDALVGEEFKSLPDTAIETASKMMDELAYPDMDANKARSKNVAPFGGKLDAHEHLKDIEKPEYLTRTGTTIATPSHLENSVSMLSATEAMLKLVDALKRNLTAQEAQFLRGRYAAGVPEDQIEKLIEQFKRPVADAVPKVGLRVAGAE